MKEVLAPSCPIPQDPRETIELAHGGGGRLMRGLLERLFLPTFDAQAARARHDSARLDLGDAGSLAFTTDAYVVKPLFFPGGDIGRLSVFGTVNDLAMSGATPLALAAAFVIEEGFGMRDLERIVRSMKSAADEVGVSIVTGDTKVVDRGKGDGLYVTTTGVGRVPRGVEITPARARSGDVVIVSGDLGRHGIAVLSVREGLAFEGALASDLAPLHAPIAALLEAEIDLHFARDLTRGGLASALNELALDGRVTLELEETRIPVSDPVAAAAELLGLDPLYVACEGRFVALVPEAHADRALEVLASVPASRDAVRVGQVLATGPGSVHLRTRLGGRRALDLLSGEQLPRIC